MNERLYEKFRELLNELEKRGSEYEREIVKQILTDMLKICSEEEEKIVKEYIEKVDKK